jgi:glycosyltransferase involved in cell wall biosynthesis
LLEANRMKILVLSFYFRPDLSAGSFRTTALVGALAARAPAGSTIHVVTTSPNRYRTFSSTAPETERAGSVEITRISLPAHSSDMRGQARAFLHFARAARAAIRERDYDVMFATSSRLMTATLGASIARTKRLPLYLDIRDIFVETIGDILPKWLAMAVRMLFSGVERWTINSARRVNLVSRGFEGYFARRYGGRTFSWHTNGVDEEFAVPEDSPQRPSGDPRPLVLYAGNLGESQALHHILPNLAVALRDRARFLVIGDGGRRNQLEAALRAAGADNVEMRTPVPRAELVTIYRQADVLFLHLGDQPAFERVLPSKLFEYGALGKPVLAGVGGYAAKFVVEEIRNATVFAPCDVEGGIAAFGRLSLEPTPRPEFIAKFLRSNIVGKMADEVCALAAGARK